MAGGCTPTTILIRVRVAGAYAAPAGRSGTGASHAARCFSLFGRQLRVQCNRVVFLELNEHTVLCALCCTCPPWLAPKTHTSTGNEHGRRSSYNLLFFSRPRSLRPRVPKDGCCEEDSERHTPRIKTGSCWPTTVSNHIPTAKLALRRFSAGAGVCGPVLPSRVSVGLPGFLLCARLGEHRRRIPLREECAGACAFTSYCKALAR